MRRRKTSARHITVVNVRSAIAAFILSVEGLFLLLGRSINSENARVTESGWVNHYVLLHERIRFTGE
jgi:hypothetical protein